MHRFSIVFLSLLFLISCIRHLVVREINTWNRSFTPRTAPVDFVMESMVKPYRASIEKEMNTLIAISAALLVKAKPESKLTNPMNLYLIEGDKRNTFTAVIFNL